MHTGNRRSAPIPPSLAARLVVNGKPLTIVGVGPRGFYGTTVGERPLVFVPITFRWLPSPTRVPAARGPQELLGLLCSRA